MTGSDIRVDVNLYDSKNKSSSVSSCVPLEKFDTSGKKLSDLRKALIEKGGIDAGKYVETLECIYLVIDTIPLQSWMFVLQCCRSPGQ